MWPWEWLIGALVVFVMCVYLIIVILWPDRF